MWEPSGPGWPGPGRRCWPPWEAPHDPAWNFPPVHSSGDQEHYGMTTRHFTAEELSAWLDGELELDAAQQAHLKECPQCIQAVERRQGLRRIARRATPP